MGRAIINSLLCNHRPTWRKQQLLSLWTTFHAGWQPPSPTQTGPPNPHIPPTHPAGSPGDPSPNPAGPWTPCCFWMWKNEEIFLNSENSWGILIALLSENRVHCVIFLIWAKTKSKFWMFHSKSGNLMKESLYPAQQLLADYCASDSFIPFPFAGQLYSLREPSSWCGAGKTIANQKNFLQFVFVGFGTIDRKLICWNANKISVIVLMLPFGKLVLFSCFPPWVWNTFPKQNLKAYKFARKKCLFSLYEKAPIPLFAVFQMAKTQNASTQESLIQAVKDLSEKLGNVTILCKGPTDIICDGTNGIWQIYLLGIYQSIKPTHPGHPKVIRRPFDIATVRKGVFISRTRSTVLPKDNQLKNEILSHHKLRQMTKQIAFGLISSIKIRDSFLT